MPTSKARKDGGWSGQQGIVLAGLVGGLLLGAVWLAGRGWAAGGRPTESAPREESVPRSLPREERGLSDLEERVQELERRRLERRVAELEAELSDESPSAEERSRRSPERRQSSSTSLGSGERADRRAADSAPPTARGRDSQLAGEQGAGPLTLAYWNGVNEIISRESSMRAAPTQLTAANAGGFVAARAEAGRFASGAIRELDTKGVDPEATALGRELVAWYEEEAQLGERAQSLLGSSDLAARKGSAGSAWKSGEEQHRQACDAINRRAAELRTRLTKKYGLEFPKLN